MAYLADGSMKRHWRSLIPLQLDHTGPLCRRQVKLFWRGRRCPKSEVNTSDRVWYQHVALYELKGIGSECCCVRLAREQRSYAIGEFEAQGYGKA